MGRLDGSTVIVTGGARGIGEGIALVLAREGADVAIGDLNVAGAQGTVEQVRGIGRKASAHELDVTDQASAGACVEAVLAEHGQIDVLVNNAGVIHQRLSPRQMTPQDFETCYAVNVKGMWIMSQAVVPHFRERGGGRIVNIASIAGRKGMAGMAPYSVSKAGAISLTQSMAMDLGPSNINVNAVCPGLLWTDMWRHLESQISRVEEAEAVEERRAFDAQIKSRCPLGREQTPEDIGMAVAFLASDDARNITGQALNVDGGIEMN